MNRDLYTIGYSGFEREDFIKSLSMHFITLLVDVRSHPFSQYYSQYNKNNLEKALNSNKIHYRSYANELGGKQESKNYLTEENYLDFERYANSETFLIGYEKILHSLELGHRICLMCAEKDPYNCHRAIMITRQFHQNGFRITHLLPNDITTTQEEIELRLLDRYAPQDKQIHLFQEPLSTEERLKFAYKMRNRDMGLQLLRNINKD